MHSPPPTPNTRSSTAAAAVRIGDRLAAKPANDRVNPKKRTRDQAGLITPRETPAKAESKRQNADIDTTAKILFPGKKRRKFQVFEDRKKPDPFYDDAPNPFVVPVGSSSHEHGSSEPPATKPQSDEEPSRPVDGLNYVFRGRKVFRKFKTEAEAELAASMKPQRLFSKEMSNPKLSNPFDDDEEDGFDGLELSTYHSGTRSHGGRALKSPPKA